MATTKWRSAMEDRIFEAQQKLILKRFGADAANCANYGWGFTSVDDEVIIETKVYGHGVLITNAKHPSRQLNHQFDPF